MRSTPAPSRSSGAQSSRSGTALSEAHVRAVFRAVVAEVAPDELVLVAAMARLTPSGPVEFASRPGRQAPLGFGVTEVAVLVAPVVWMALEGAAQRFGEWGADRTTRGLGGWAQKLRRRPSGGMTIPPLTVEQLNEVRRHVLESAAGRGLDEAGAIAIADALISRLALAALGTDSELSADPTRPSDPDSGS